MKKILSNLSVLALALLPLTYLFQKESPREDWKAYLKSHPYSQNSNLSVSDLEKLPKRDRPDLAMQQNFLMTVDPKTGEVPVDRLVKAFEKQKSFRAQYDVISNVTWVEKGPNNIGGRTRALMWDPNDSNNEKLWAAGVAGGIWFNNDITDINSSWQNVDDFMANLAITTLAYDPTNTQIFYAGTGEGFFNGDAVRGAGIFKSTDGGSNWALISDTETSDFNYVQKVVVAGTGTILAATRTGIFRSTDGENFSSVSAGDFGDLELASNGDVYAGSLFSGDVLRSTDDGVSWSTITPSGTSSSRIELAVAPSASDATETTVLYAVGEQSSNVGFLKKSTDGGANWSDITIPNYRSQDCSESSSDFTRGQAWYDLILAVKPTDENVLLAGGINVSKSADGGATMSEVSYWTFPGNSCDTYVHADIHNILFRPGNPDEAVIGSDGGVSYSSNVGSSNDPTFSERNKDYNVTQFYSVAAQNTIDVNYFLAGAQDNGTQQFTDAGGLSTVDIFGGDGAFCFIDQDNNNLQISSYVYNVYGLHNASGTQVATLANDQNSGRFINPADYDNFTNILYSAGNSNELKRISGIASTPNSQETISISINSETISAIRADANLENRIFIGTGSGGIYRIDDAHDTPTVTEITSNVSTGGYISSIDIGSSDDELIVTFSNYGVTSVWYTDDGGANWSNKDNDGSLPDMPVRWALFNPNNSQEVLLATELGVWSTSDITATNPGWGQSSDNLANVRCDMLQHRTSDNLVVVATHGRGIFTSNVFDGIATPTDFVVSQDGSGINLTWVDNSDLEDNYVVERLVGDETDYTILATLAANTTTYIDSEVASNQTISYRVYGTSAIKADSRIAESSILSIPAVPVLDEASNVTSTEFTISWTVTDEASQFVLDVSENDDFSDFLPGFENKTLFNLSTVLDELGGGTYHFRVAARNASGDSEFSTSGSVTLDPLSVNSDQISFYPNPSKGTITLEGVDADASINMITLLGQQVELKVKKLPNQIQLDISHLNQGTYGILIENGSRRIYKTIIKQ
ncbi:T9SS type A sorting domain-containing protein [Ekhidna sp.]|uniref:T9SS type A sorting domain-containing protein n=2 Tax=Ekhidna sp. TaxID=2608089 RepID=UPI003297CE04